MIIAAPLARSSIDRLRTDRRTRENFNYSFARLAWSASLRVCELVP